MIDRGRHVAEPVQELVGRYEVTGLPDDRETDVADLRDELVQSELGPVPRDRLELVERPAGMSEAAAAHLSERDAARCDDRPDGERRLVTDAACRMLVDDLAPELGTEVDRLAAANHRVGEHVGLARREPAEEHRHAERSHLVIGNLATGVAENQLRELVVRKLLAVPLALDELGRADHLVATKTLTAVRTRSGKSKSRSRDLSETIIESR